MASFPTVQDLGDRLRAEAERQLGTFIRIVGRADGMTETAGSAWIATGEPHPFANLGVTDPRDVASTEAAIEGLSRVGQPTAIAALGAEAEGVTAALEGAGYVVAESETAMHMDLAELADTVTPAGYDVIEVETGADVEGWNDAMSRGYEIPPRISAIFGPAPDHAEAGVRYFIARRDGRAVAASAVLLDQEIAGIYAVATLPSERKKGLGAAVTAAGLRAAADAGYRVGVLQSSPAGVNVYKGLGFEPCSTFNIHVKA